MRKSWQNHTRVKDTCNSPGRLRLARRIGAVATTVALATITNTGSTTAGPEHYGTDPAHTGCNQNAALIATRDITTEFGVFVSKVELYYSYSCQTNWIRVQNNPAGGTPTSTSGPTAGASWRRTTTVRAPATACRSTHPEARA